MTHNFPQVMQSVMAKAQRYMDQAPRTVSVLAERHYRDSFRNQGFLDKTLERWKPKKSSGTILVKTGNLRGSIVGRVVSPKLVTVSTDLDYAPYQNFGTQTIPARKFIGKSETLNQRIKNELMKLIRRFF
jgi:phage gpG-like protein